MRYRTQFDYSEEELARLYTGYDHTQWRDHRFRVNVSASIVSTYLKDIPMASVLDPAAGDGEIVASLIDHDRHFVIGDLSCENIEVCKEKLYGHYNSEFWVADLFDTVLESPIVDITILSEILEHIEDPDGFLKIVAKKSMAVFISTPLEEAPGANPEHYWSWGREDIVSMLVNAGFKNIILYSELDLFVAKYQIHLATK